ncbi:MAG TPA: tRNA (guanosine(37)-N1)-methyltransferase TrmD [Patescibacteria group bacterium]|nr:tRNA (guanosine(37)-N1)-methyltransferase TrmD [Patescibacteria group bacterium]
MIIDILTLFPGAYLGFLDQSLILRAQKNKIVKINVIDLRKYTKDKHRTVDDRPYGGGPGMVMRVDIVDRALKNLKSKVKSKKLKVILLTPQGKTFHQKMAQRLSKFDHLILICGHFEGFDERIRKLVDMEISVGDFVLTGGELASQVVCDAVVRLIPGVVGKEESLKEESFSNSLLEYPQYTRPEIYQKMAVPKILLSGNHAQIQKWRQKMSLSKTKKNRPDLLKNN